MFPTLNELALGAALPTVTAGLLWWGLKRFAGPLAARYAAPLALAAGWLAAYAGLSTGPLAPESHWHWLPVVVVAASLVGAITRTEGLRTWERFILQTLACAAAMALLVPTWEDLAPSRLEQWVLWTVVAVASCVAIDPWTARQESRLQALVLLLVMLCGAAVLGWSGNLRFAQSLGGGVAAMGGIFLGALFRRDSRALSGIALPWSLLVTGLMHVGRVNSFSEVPLASYLLIPLAPLALLLTLWPPLSRWTGWPRAALMALPVMIAVVGAVLAASAGSGGDEW